MGWTDYYRFTQGRRGSPLLARALDAAAAGTALDLGCGAGHECRTLLEAGWHVHAIDGEAAAIDAVRALAQDLATGSLATQVSRFEDLESLPDADLVHAGLSLPFCRPEHFAGFWSLLRGALRPGGVFAGHLFGPNDAWADSPLMAFHSRAQVLVLLEGLEIVVLDEFDAVGPSMNGPKHWHRFDIVARRPGCHPR